jgi:glycosyltransferase involved in cell wall biosynthesis
MTARSIVQVVLNLAEGGMETMAVNLSLGLSERGHRVTVVALDSGGLHEQTLREHGVAWQVMGGRALTSPKRHLALKRVFRRADADVIHTHHFAPLMHSVVAASWAGWAPMVHTEHSYQYLEPRRDYRWAMRALSARCRAVVMVGRAMRPYYRDEVGVPERKLKVILNGVTLPSLNGGGGRSARRAALGLPDGFLIVSAGRFFPVKRYQDLLAGAAEARRQVKDLHLVLLGTGPERERLVAETRRLGMEEAVSFPGWRKDVEEFVACGDIFALTSDSEGLPMAVLEAMALRIPVIATAVGDLPEMLGDGEGGKLVPARNPDRLAEAIVTLARDGNLRERMGRWGHERVARDYSLATMVEAYEELYG